VSGTGFADDFFADDLSLGCRSARAIPPVFFVRLICKPSIPKLIVKLTRTHFALAANLFEVGSLLRSVGLVTNSVGDTLFAFEDFR